MGTTTGATSESNPIQKSTRNPRWPLGVVSGGAMMDMLENLSQTARIADYALVLWLQKHYIEPFGRVDRTDGLIVTDELHLLTLYTAYERYIEVSSERTRVQNLYVHGLEASHVPEARDFDTIPTTVPERTEYRKWRAAEMYARNGLEVKNKGLFVENWIESNGWNRKLWRAPNTKDMAKVGNVDQVTIMAEDEGKGARKDSSAFVGDDA